MKAGWILILFQIATSLRVTNTNNKVLLLPKANNMLVPFVLEPETESEKIENYVLEIQCSESVKNNIEFTGTYEGFCVDGNRTDTIPNINAALQGTFAMITGDISKMKDLRIGYMIHYSENGKNAIAFEQDLSVAQDIPINKVNRMIFYQPHSSTTFDLKILDIQASYFRNALNNEFTIVISNNKFPDWLTFEFEKNELYFSGKTPANLEDEYSFDFSIQDKQTGLLSSLVNIQITSSVEGQSPQGKVLVIVLFLIFSGVIACILLIIFITSKKKHTDAKNLQNSVNAQNKGLQDTTTHVLSDSILQWNKKLVERHRTKNFDFIETSAENESPGRSPGFAYEKFDDTFEMTDEEKGPDIKMSDKLSDIRPDDDARHKDDGNKSSFFEDIRF